MQTLRGHSGHILALAFDTERIVTGSGDNTLKYWQWGKKNEAQDKHHVIDKGETLNQICKRYDVKISDLMAWNGIKEMRQCYPGMKLIVHKGDPDQPTDAERVALERERKRIEAQSYVEKKIKKGHGEGNRTGTEPYNRVHKLASDLDLHSISNRMFLANKKQTDVFPDLVSTDVEHHTLSRRLMRDDPTTHTHLPTGARPYFYIGEANEDEWGTVADALGQVMIDMFVEYMAYEVVQEEKGRHRDKGFLVQYFRFFIAFIFLICSSCNFRKRYWEDI